MIYILHYVCFLVPLPAIMLTKNSMNKVALTFIIIFLLGSSASAQIHKMERRDSVDRTYNLNPVVVTGSGHHDVRRCADTPDATDIDGPQQHGFATATERIGQQVYPHFD